MIIKKGSHIILGKKDETWEKWCWVTYQDKSGWMHESLIQKLSDSEGIANEDFSSTELSVKKDEQVTVLKELDGWFWCKNRNGEEGWIPSYALTADSN